MDIFQTILLGSALAMDAATVAMTNGLNDPKIKKPKALLIAISFGVFQGVMPLIGFFASSVFVDFIAKFTGWLALILLSLIGGKMIYESKKNDENEEYTSKLKLKTLFLQAVATSIDALAVGIIFVNTGSNATKDALTSSLIIALTTFIITYIAVFIGHRFGLILKNKAQILGGLLLIAIGIKIFIEYLAV